MKAAPFLGMVLFALAAPVAAQDVTPAIDPGFAGTAAANREALDRSAARSGGAGHHARRSASGVTSRRAVALHAAERRRAIRRARREQRW